MRLILKNIKVEKKDYFNFQASLKLILFSLINIFLMVSCDDLKHKKKEKNDTEFKNEILDNAIKLTNNNSVIKDSINNLKNIGADFIVCYVGSDGNYNKLSFDVNHFANSEILPYKITGDFKLRVIQGIDVLFTEFEHRTISNNAKSQKKVKELLKKGLITFNGRNILTHGNSITFIFCKNNEKNFKCFTYEMLGKAEELAHKEERLFNHKVFYPKCD